MKIFLKHAKHKLTVTRAVKVALIVGTVLALVNHYDAILNGTLTASIIFQILLTYLVPYVVATYGSAGHARHLELEEMKKIKNVERQELQYLKKDSEAQKGTPNK